MTALTSSEIRLLLRVIVAGGLTNRQRSGEPIQCVHKRYCWDRPLEMRLVARRETRLNHAEAPPYDVINMGAGQAAIYFADVASSVTLLVRGSALWASMSHYLAERIEHTPKNPDSISDGGGINRGRRSSGRAGAEEHCDRRHEDGAGSALFVFIGALPHTDWLGDRIARDDRGFILTGPDVGAPERRLEWNLERDPYLLETSIPGVFAAGNVRHGSGKRVSTAVGEGAMAVMSIWQYRAQVGL